MGLFTGSIAIRGIRGPIPSGYILGRTDSGSGPPQLISLPVLGQKMAQSGIPVTRLSSLQDVAFSTLTDKQHLEYNAAAGKWVNVAPPALATLTDVVEVAPANGQVLTFETATQKWKNKNPSANQVNNYLGPTTVGLTSFQPGIGATLTKGNWGGVPALISAGMNVTDIRFYATAAAASAVVTPAIYADNAGAPGALIAVGSATTGVVQGLNSFACAFSASADQVIWLGVLVETADIILATCDYKPNAYFAAAGPLPPNTAPTATFQIGTCWASMWADCTPVGITSSPLSSLSPAVLGLLMSASLSTSVSLVATESLGLVMAATLQTGVVAVAASMLVGITMTAALTVSANSPQFVNAGTPTDTANGGSFTLPLPASRVNGNLLVAIVAMGVSGGGTITNNNSWTFFTANGASDYLVAYRYVDGTETNVTFTCSSNCSTSGVILQFHNTAAAAPIANHNTATGTSTTPTSTGLTTANNNSLAFAFGTINTNTALSGVTGFTQETGSNHAGAPASIAGADMLIATAGASGTVTFTFGASAGWRVSIYEIKGP